MQFLQAVSEVVGREATFPAISLESIIPKDVVAVLTYVTQFIPVFLAVPPLAARVHEGTFGAAVLQRLNGKVWGLDCILGWGGGVS